MNLSAIRKDYMENNKEYLSEKDYQEKTKKLKKIGLILICIGAPMAICFVVNIMLTELPFSISALFGILGVLGFPILFSGIYCRFVLPNKRAIASYMVQQQMPIAKESAEKMAPTAGVVAKEITKGVKEGLKEEDK